MTNALEIANNYIATWNAADAASRDALLANHWAEHPTYHDPLMAATNAGEIAGLVGAVRDRFPGFRFSLINTPDGHGNFVRFSWGLGPEGAEPVIEGSDVIMLENGRMKNVVGFLDKVPSAA
jgi:hypothetical protein